MLTRGIPIRCKCELWPSNHLKQAREAVAPASSSATLSPCTQTNWPSASRLVEDECSRRLRGATLPFRAQLLDLARRFQGNRGIGLISGLPRSSLVVGGPLRTVPVIWTLGRLMIPTVTSVAPTTNPCSATQVVQSATLPLISVIPPFSAILTIVLLRFFLFRLFCTLPMPRNLPPRATYPYRPPKNVAPRCVSTRADESAHAVCRRWKRQRSLKTGQRRELFIFGKWRILNAENRNEFTRETISHHHSRPRFFARRVEFH